MTLVDACKENYHTEAFQIAKEKITGKRILLLGMGREGWSTYHFLKKMGGYSSITVADCNMISGLDPDVEMITGDSYQSSLDAFDLVFKSPGVVLEKDFSEYTCEITSQTELFLMCYGAQTVGITGTKGKSTTTSLIYHALQQGNLQPVLCGNIGIPPLDLFFEMKSDSIAVFEMSCHQLEYTRVSPHIGILLNLHEEHLDHYGSYEKYIAAKCNVFRHMQADDMVYINIENVEEAKECRGQIRRIVFTGDILTHDAQSREVDAKNIIPSDVWIDATQDVVRLGEDDILQIPTKNIQLLGHHNEFNIGVAYGVCRTFGMTTEQFMSALTTFESLPHRLKLVGVRDGIRFYDDSISTICETTIQALQSVEQVETLLIGGMDRGIDYSSLISYLSQCEVAHIICMYATGKRIYEEAKASGISNLDHFYVVEDLREAVTLAKEKTHAGGACILSPAAASYGYFKNFEERGDRFQQYALYE